jgi:hypothetical protein
MGTWDKVSQWCNRLLGIFKILWPVLFWESELEEGGDAARLAEKEITSREGAGRLFWLCSDPHKDAQPRKQAFY